MGHAVAVRQAALGQLVESARDNLAQRRLQPFRPAEQQNRGADAEDAERRHPYRQTSRRIPAQRSVGFAPREQRLTHQHHDRHRIQRREDRRPQQVARGQQHHNAAEPGNRGRHGAEPQPGQEQWQLRQVDENHRPR